MKHDPRRQHVLIRPGEGAALDDGLACRVSSASVGGAYCSFELVTPPGEGVPLHVHAREDEIYFVLDGAYQMQCADEVFRADPGAWVVLPRNVPHAFRNPGPVPSRALIFFVPGGFDDFVQELRQLPTQDASDEEKRNLIRRKYGIQMLPKTI